MRTETRSGGESFQYGRFFIGKCPFMPPIYLDYNATTPVDPDVLDVMLPYFTEHFGNASSAGHAYGWAADEAVKLAREQVAALLGVHDPGEIIFTSGATEALNMAIHGVAVSKHRGHIITAATEHRAVLEPCRSLEQRGYDVTYLPVGEDGLVQPDVVEEALREDTVLVCVMWANNETGVLNPIPQIAERLHSHGAAFLLDATQAVGKVPVSIDGIDLLACSAHKFCGPMGVGALYQRPGITLAPLILGGGQQEERRGGTLNVPGIVGMGAAAEKAGKILGNEASRLGSLRDHFEASLLDALPDLRINGASAPRLPQTSSVTFPGADAARLMRDLRGLAISSGSACSSGDPRPSHVLKAMGLSDSEAKATLRFSLGRFTTGEEVETAIGQVVEAVGKPKKAMPVYT